MDPATALKIASSSLSLSLNAVEIGRYIYTFVRDAKKVDETLKAFAQEIQSLGASCALVNNRVKKLVQEHQERCGKDSTLGSTDEIWRYLEEQIAACAVTITGLKKAIGKTAEVGKDEKLNFLNKAGKQFSVNLKTEDIARNRERIRSHTASLQIVLLCISIEVSYLAPQRADQHLQFQLAELTDSVRQLSDILHHQSSPQIEQTGNERAILQAGTEIISSGETLYQDSVCDGSIRGLDEDGRAFVHDWLSSADTRTAEYSSIIHGIESQSDIDQAQADQQATPVGKLMRLINATQQERSSESLPHTDVNDNFAKEIAERSIALSFEIFARREIEKTYEMVQEALDLIQEVPARQRNLTELHEVRYMLGALALMMQPLLERKSSLLTLLATTSDTALATDEELLATFRLGHILAVVNVQLGNVEKARALAQILVEKRIKRIGRSDSWTYNSISLLARITKIQGNSARSEVLLALLPQHDTSLKHKYDGLLAGEPDTDSGRNLDGGTTADMSNAMAGLLGASRQNQKPYKFRTPALKQLAVHSPVYSKGWMPIDLRQSYIDGLGLKANSEIARALCNGQDEEASSLARQMAHTYSLGKQQKKRNTISQMFKRSSKLDKTHPPLPPGEIPALSLAALFGLPNIMLDLINAGADVEAEDCEGRRPLYFAALGGRVRSVVQLLEARAAVDGGAPDKSALSVAARTSPEALDVVDVLLHHSADPLRSIHVEGSPLHIACARGHTPLVIAFSSGNSGLSHLRKIRLDEYHASFWLNIWFGSEEATYADLDSYGTAIVTGQHAVLKYLVGRRIDPKRIYKMHSSLTAYGWTVCATALAAAAGNLEVVRWMLENNLAHRCEYSLSLAIKLGHEDIATEIFDAGLEDNTIHTAPDFDLARTAADKGMKILSNRLSAQDYR